MAPEDSTPPNSAAPQSSSTVSRVLTQAQEISAKVWEVASPILERLSLQLGKGIDWTLDTGLPQLQTKIATSGLYQQKVQPRLEPLQQRVTPIWEKVQPLLLTLWTKAIQPLWHKVLSWLRSRLSEPLTREISDKALTVMILGLVLVLYWLIGVITPDGPKVAQQPPQTVAPAPSTQPAPVGNAPQPKALEKVQTRLASIVDTYDADLLISMQPIPDNGPTPKLALTLSDRWYALSKTQQDQFASDILRISQSQQFPALTVFDEVGHPLARNPVVGNNVIVLRRQP